MNARSSRTGALALAATILLAIGARSIAAQELENRLYDTFQFTASGALIIFNANLRIDSDDGSIGTEIDTEDDLGLAPTKLQPRGAMRWRPGRRHEIELGYQFARRTAEKTLERDITVGDSTFAAGLDTRGRFDSDQAFFAYRFAFTARENTQIGVGLGLGAIFQKTNIQALATVSNGNGSATVEREFDESIVGPTASVGLYGRFRLGERWYLEPELRAIYVGIDRYDARVFDAGVAARYFFTNGVGVEGAYGIQAIRVDVEPGTLGIGGRLKYGTQNLRLGVVFAP
ncbi:MAG: hypothetical protein R3195_17355 [Gemmatimonadota bacterium]|nr:hypothetical protein [Gemmatimonadota bacterium]